VERWRLFVALAAALGALPLLAIDNVSSAEGRDESSPVEVLGISTERSDSSLDLLASRASSWAVAREELRTLNVNEALSLEQQANAEAAAVRAVEDARLAAEAARQGEAAKKAEAARQAEATRKANAAAAAVAAARRTTTTAKPVPKTTSTARKVASGEPTAAQWLKLRQCESANNYQSLSAGGRFRGAYQFSPSTWDWVAAQVAPQLLGVDPIDASPGDQDNMALNLYYMRGVGQWPVCGNALL
jgi:hypothetical protein